MQLVTFEAECPSTVAEELASRLKHFNEQRAGPLNSQALVLSVRDDKRALVAGLTGESFWNVLYVDVLWVDEQYRGMGYGASLLKRAELIARERSCKTVYLSTFEFQAPDFYLRLGYSVIGELRDVPQGFRRQWFCKTLHEQHVV